MVACSLRAGGAAGNRHGSIAISSPQLIAITPLSCRRLRRVGVESKPAQNARLLETTMRNTDRPEPNAELARSFEPLRVVFALSALLLGVIASLRI